MTRDADETMPEELRQAIESERLWDELPPEVEERLARRIGASLATLGAAETLEPGSAPGSEAARGVATPPHALPAVVRTASFSFKWGAAIAGGLLAAGAMGAGLVAVLKSSTTSVEPPPRAIPAPVERVGPGAPLPLPPVPVEEAQVPPTVPELAPLPPAPSLSPQKPAAPSRPKVKRVPAPAPVAPAPAELPPAPAQSRASHVSPRDWSLLRLAREANAQGNYPEALSAIAQHAREYPSSQLEQEREALRIHALVGLGRREEGRALAESFEQRFPESMLLEGIREAVGEK